ncbi:leucine-rich repeat-containing protein 15-like [Mytilus californianus]|uniref:leucine-rich repeat-containing protein 15-like n=1 Tax=Mytilus californianus TaxID=6549 RepID=UPI0022462C2D|nr:leucine-rich repeat-containing protein 15-like [Mytilus californianus]
MTHDENNIFSRTANLEILSINKICHLSIIEPRAFACPSLKELKFSDNGFRVKTALFKPVPSLQKLDLSNNYITNSPVIFRNLFSPLSNLIVLNLRATHIKRLPERLFQKIPFLKILNLKGNEIVTWNRNVFKNLTSLRHLYLDGNNIQVINESSFPIQLLWSLEKFDISQNQFWCTCAQRWFVDYLRSSNISKILKNWPIGYSCVYPDDKKKPSSRRLLAHRRASLWERLILIMHSQIDSSHMTNSKRSLLDTTPHLQYQQGLGEDLFWSAITKAVRKPFKDPPIAIL